MPAFIYSLSRTWTGKTLLDDIRTVLYMVLILVIPCAILGSIIGMSFNVTYKYLENAGKFLLLLIIFFIAGMSFLYTLAYLFPSHPRLSDEECKSRIVSWCTTCKFKNWESEVTSSEVKNCFLQLNLQVPINCEDAKQTCEQIISVS
jgi:hypothetical protein